MKIKFEKYHGCGNDFIIIDNSRGQIERSRLTIDVIKDLCDRRYGIGADGLMIVESANDADFHMFYANADGRESTMCGNGGRCIVAFAFSHDLISRNCEFDAIDGRHSATIDKNGEVQLGMQPVNTIEQLGEAFVLDTGSPHYVTFVQDIEDYPVVAEGRSIRNSLPFVEEGINVNFVEIKDSICRIRTYERGVEDETEACGTGVTGAAIVLSQFFDKGQEVELMTNGGLLKVKIGKSGKSIITNISLCGPATLVYKGEVEIEG